MAFRNVHSLPIPDRVRPDLKLPSNGSQKPRGTRGWFIIAVVILGLGSGGYFLAHTKEKVLHVEAEQGAQEVLGVEDRSDEDVVVHTISEGDIPADVFSEYGKWDANDTAELLEHSDVYDFTRLTIGRNIRFIFDKGAETAKRLEYDRNTETMVVAERDGEHMNVYQQDIEYAVTEAWAGATIHRFLYVDALDAGLTEPTVLEMGDIFSFDIDFTTEIREGDSFSVVYEKRKRSGEDAPDGYILAAKFINDGEEYFAYHFESDGYSGYYDSEGRELEKQFLRAPLSYRRITSGFTGARMHPITKKVTAHYQIDYAAPIGTPVVATAHGTVTQAGYAGGWGNIVRMKHDNDYTTHYAHLSNFAKGIRSGAHVSRGEVVGYVGSTGWSTGAHLDYGMKQGGTPVNPLALKLPKGEPLADEKMAEFERVKEKYQGML